MIQWILAIWYLVPLPFLNPAWTSGISWFTFCFRYGAGAAATRCWRDCEEIPHLQRQISPSKMVGARVTAVLYWSNFEEIPPHPKAKEKPQNMVRGTKFHLESNPIPARDAQWALTNLMCTRTQKPHRDWDRALFVSALDFHRSRGSGCSRPGYGISPLGGGCN